MIANRRNSRLKLDEKDGEFLFTKVRRHFVQSYQVLTIEIGGNIGHLRRFAKYVFNLISFYTFMAKYFLQQWVEFIAEIEEHCDNNDSKNTISLNSTDKKDSLLHGNETYQDCLCRGKYFEVGDIKVQQKHEDSIKNLKNYWTKNTIKPPELNDARILCAFLDSTIPGHLVKTAIDDWFKSPKTSVKDWTFVLKLADKCCPGILKNNLLLNCVCLHGTLKEDHLSELFILILSSKRITWKKYFIRESLQIAILFERIFQPSFELSGKGLEFGILNSINEFNIKTLFSCQRFSVQLSDASGETWNESSENALIKLNKVGSEENYISGQHITYMPVLQILRLSQTHYKVLYTPKVAVEHIIIIRAGRNRTRQIKGSPFVIKVPLRKSTTKSKMTGHRPRRMSSFVDNQNQAMTLARNRSSGVLRTSILEEDEDISKKEKPKNNRIQELTENPSKLSSVLRKTSQYAFSASKVIVSPFLTKILDPKEDPNKLSPDNGLIIPERYSDRVQKANGLSKLSIAQSRELHIRKITIIRYLNSAMPSLDEYFMGGFSDDNYNSDGNTQTDKFRQKNKKRWSNISVLLRQKMQTESTSPEPVKKTKVNKYSNKNHRKNSKTIYNNRHDSDANWHDKYHRIRKQHHCESYASCSSSSSENGGDDDEDDKVMEENCEECQKDSNFGSLKVNKENSAVSVVKNSNNINSRFGIIFANQKNTADYLLNSDLHEQKNDYLHKKSIGIHENLPQLTERKNDNDVLLTQRKCRKSTVTVGNRRSTTVNQNECLLAAADFFYDRIVNAAIKHGIEEFIKLKTIKNTKV